MLQLAANEEDFSNISYNWQRSSLVVFVGENVTPVKSGSVHLLTAQLRCQICQATRR